MPQESPYLYGLHPNAEIGFLTTTSENLFRTIFEMQPRDAQASGASTVTREDKVKTIFLFFYKLILNQTLKKTKFVLLGKANAR